MGFVLSILFFATYYLTSPVIFGPLAPFRIELILSLLLLIVSLFKLTGSVIFKTHQSAAVIGLALAGTLSTLFGAHWAGGAMSAFIGFFPNAGLAYYLVCLHCNSKRKLKIIILTLLFVCFFVIANGCMAFLHGVPQAPVHNMESHEIVPLPYETTTIPYLLAVRSDAGELLYRLEGKGLLNDPNDFGQLLVCVIPLAFIFWRPKRAFRNVVFVILPVCGLLFGTYLTHSRGALLALVAVGVVAARRRVGTLPALLLAVAFFVGAMALHFTGGRGISTSAGADRAELWSDGLQILKSHPLFGVGPGQMPDLTDSHHTAHNSVVVCAAELGSFGLFFWSLFLFPTFRDALAAGSAENVSEAQAIETKEEPLHLAARKVVAVDKAEINRMARLLFLSLTGFLVAGWFLSRAFVMTLFLLGGMVEVVYEMALQQGMVAPRMRLARVIPYSASLAVILVFTMYIMLRVMNLTR